MTRRVLALLAAAGMAAVIHAAPGKPLTAQDVIAAFKARDWKKLRAITADRDVFVMPDGGAPERIGRISRDALFDRMADCVVGYAFLKGEYQPDNAVLMISRNQPVPNRGCDKYAYGLTFEIVGDKAVFGPVYHTTERDRIDCPPDGRAPPPPAPPAPPKPRESI